MPGTYTVQVVASLGAVSTTTNYTLVVAPSVINYTTSANNVNLFQLAGTPACPISLTVNIAAGVAIGSTSTGQPALTTGPFASGSSITINNAGTIAGAGGDGGTDAGHNLTSCPNYNGLPGGNALDIATGGVVVNNTGTIGGGGGGGGAGAELGGGNPCTAFRVGGSGGGGAGSAPGNGGADQGCGGGNNGTLLSGGGGGPGQTNCSVSCNIIFNFGPYKPGNGGAGGALGQPGAGGGGASGFIDTGVCGAGSGGAAGCAIKTNGNTYTITGAAVLGAVCP